MKGFINLFCNTIQQSVATKFQLADTAKKPSIKYQTVTTNQLTAF